MNVTLYLSEDGKSFDIKGYINREQGLNSSVETVSIDAANEVHPLLAEMFNANSLDDTSKCLRELQRVTRVVRPYGDGKISDILRIEGTDIDVSLYHLHSEDPRDSLFLTHTYMKGAAHGHSLEQMIHFVEVEALTPEPLSYKKTRCFVQ